MVDSFDVVDILAFEAEHVAKLVFTAADRQSFSLPSRAWSG